MTDRTDASPPLTSMSTTRWRNVVSVLGVLILLRVAIAYVPIPLEMVGPVSLVVSALFILVPVYGLFRGGEIAWTPKLIAVTIATGLLLQFGLVFGFAWFAPRLEPTVAKAVFVPVGALSQSGLLIWCLGLGAALAQAIRDRNMIVPISIFLALFDIWLVFVPEGPVGQIARGNQAQLASIAFTVPQPATPQTVGKAAVLAYVGPADFLFIAMFFTCLFRFRLDARRTAMWLVPVLAAYLLVVLVARDVEIGPISLAALPALVPIASVVLVVNWRAFAMKGEELIATLLVAIIGTGLLVWRFSVQPATPAEPETSAPGQAAPESGQSLAPTRPH